MSFKGVNLDVHIYFMLKGVVSEIKGTSILSVYNPLFLFQEIILLLLQKVKNIYIYIMYKLIYVI